MVDVILGLQWGDEGKGKIIDYFSKNYDIVARFSGGSNAGHSLFVNDEKVVLHQIPSGIFHNKITNVIGNGVVLDLIELKKEFATISNYTKNAKNRLVLSDKSTLVLPTHKMLDKQNEDLKGDLKIGTTLKGIGPTYADKYSRNSLRLGDLLTKDFTNKYLKTRNYHLSLLNNPELDKLLLAEDDFFEAIEFVKTLNITNTEYFLNESIQKGKKVLAEGAQGTMLDIDFGTFPFVTSSNTITASVCSGLGISPKLINEVIGVTKAYCTRVGGGPFPTELDDNIGEKLRSIGKEFGATTGRPRRCGWIDLVALNYACMINGITKIVMTKSDVLDSFEELNVCIAYDIDGKETTLMPFNLNNLEPVYETFKGWESNTTELNNYIDLPVNMDKYIDYISEYLGIEITYISNGPNTDQLIIKYK
jgi:adenylosuccinate synthase